MVLADRLPGGRMLKRLVGGGYDQPREVRYGDVTRGPLVAEGSAAAVYASHVLEHLTLEAAKDAIANTFRMLSPCGVFRLIVPDLEWRARLYLEDLALGDADAASNLLRTSLLGQEKRRGPIRQLRRALSGSGHRWMWDFVSMSAVLEAAGFVDIRRARFGDGPDPAFAEVEREERFWGALDDLGTVRYPELAIQATKPAQGAGFKDPSLPEDGVR